MSNQAVTGNLKLMSLGNMRDPVYDSGAPLIARWGRDCQPPSRIFIFRKILLQEKLSANSSWN
jgi:hypothetical protein